MKKILGLDLGTTSIGWALVNEAENKNEKSEIIKLGVRVNPMSAEELTDFKKGNPLSVNADRTLKRGARRNLQRFKLRRQNLIDILIKNKIIHKSTVLTETGCFSTYETLSLRAKAAKEKIELEEFARILLTINKKRGYKSNRKAKSEEDGNLIDGMAVAKKLYNNNLTPGQYVYKLLLEGKNYIPDFYQSDLQNEFDKVWTFQKQFYPKILTDDFYKILENQGQQNSTKIFLAVYQIYTAENKGKKDAIKKQHYQWRSQAISQQLKIEEVAYVLVKINNSLNNSSGYLGAIGDRSKKLYFDDITVGQYLHHQIQKDNHTSLKNQVFYRQDYLDEFEKIWETQAKFHTELTNDLKNEIRDVVIFYQRKLKSQKGLISLCEFESKTIEINTNGKKKEIGPRVVPKSSPVFQEFKIWQNLNNLSFTLKKETKTNPIKQELKEGNLSIDIESKQLIFNELNIRGTLKNSDVLKLLKLKPKDWTCNFDEVEGNKTNEAIYNILQKISEDEGYGFDWNKKNALEIRKELKTTLPSIGIDPTILDFDINRENFHQQRGYEFWHLLYATEDDQKIKNEDEEIYGKHAVSLKKKLHQKFGIPLHYTNLFANINLQPDYGNLSAKAIRKIIPHLQNGLQFPEACKLAGYNHSHSINKKENLKRKLKEKLETLPKNSLRNPVVEKILNQLVNLVNQIIDEYGGFDEIRIELARELKKSAKQRKEMTQQITSATKRNEDYKKTLLKAPFNLKNPTKNDIIKYRLYKELRILGYHTLYTGKYIKPQQLFTNEIEIEHIIPKAVLYDDSFSNKTLAFKEINIEKSKMTSYDYIDKFHHKELLNYKQRVENFYANGKNEVSKGKFLKLLTPLDKLSNDFIRRDLNNTQYIAKKAKNMLLEICRKVHPTSGKVTDKLRRDWDLLNTMKELNLAKYRELGLTIIEERKNNQKVEKIIDWTKRNDHRHHAMDALVVAFTTESHTQHINTLNAESNENGVKSYIIEGHQKDKLKNKGLYIAPIPNFRSEAKKYLEQILISFKTKNKVVTKNINTSKLKKGTFKKEQLTPRGQLHKETIYGKSLKEIVKTEKVNGSFTIDKIRTVTQTIYRNALLDRIEEFNNEPKKAFTGKNALSKNPIILSNGQQLPLSVTTKVYENIFTIRKAVNADNFEDVKSLQKIIDTKTKKILEDRLTKFNGKAKEAFTDLSNNPIWLNKSKGIAIKKVTISGVNNAEALHDKKDHLGNLILDVSSKTQAVDYVSTGNNHHVAIYKDEKGKLQEQIVSLFDAVARVNQKQPIVNKNHNNDKGWKFLFTLKQNELFIFPNNEFDAREIDLLDEKNYKLISPHLFRVQKITSKDYFFRHHLETTIQDKKELKGISYIRTGLNNIENIVKIRTNHLGKIIQIGEY